MWKPHTANFRRKLQQQKKTNEKTINPTIFAYFRLINSVIWMFFPPTLIFTFSVNPPPQLNVSNRFSQIWIQFVNHPLNPPKVENRRPAQAIYLLHTKIETSLRLCVSFEYLISIVPFIIHNHFVSTHKWAEKITQKKRVEQQKIQTIEPVSKHIQG